MEPQRSPVRVRVHPLGATALIAELGTRLDTALNPRAIALASALKKRRDVRQAVPAHGNVTVQFDPDQIAYEALAAAIRRLATKRPPVEEPGRLHRIPVVYDGPDLESVATALGLPAGKVVELHSRPIYRVFLVGFVPGWAYLGPLPDELVLPRRPLPRTHVPAGSVAIAGQQTGIYPLDTPGGWHLIGRTSVRLFLPDSDPPSLLRAGDEVTFGPRRGGARAYLAVAGGVVGDRWLGSMSTNVMAGRGGMHGRPLTRGDLISAGDPLAPPVARDGFAPDALPPYADHILRVIAGPHERHLSPGSREALFKSAFALSPDSNRMGYRLDGARLEVSGEEVLSFGLVAGALQVPAGGMPILLMADHPTAGG